VRNDAALQEEDFNVLPRGMQHLDDTGPLDELVEGREIDAGGEGVDDPLDAWRRHLDQAQLGIIGLVAQEFGVQRQIGRRRQLGDEGLEVVTAIHNPHRMVIAGFGVFVRFCDGEPRARSAELSRSGGPAKAANAASRTSGFA